MLLNAVKRVFTPFLNLLISTGFDPRKFIAIRNLPRYFSEIKKYKNMGGNVEHYYPILSDYADQAGSASGHYFHQDLLIAKRIFTASPKKHVDVGSRIDGFVAHVATFREIEIIDVRYLNLQGHQNIKFLQCDVMNLEAEFYDLCDSISCLHAIEHFGLGRYSDPLDPLGYRKGFNNLLRMLKQDGTLYISFPIANQNQTYFNAHRTFQATDIFSWIDNEFKLELVSFDYVDDSGNLHEKTNLETFDESLIYGCGIYTFKKL
jgi:hypothetical protein